MGCFFDDGFYDPTVSFSSKSLILVVDNVSDKPYEKRQKTVEMNLSSKYTKNFFKTSPVSTHKHLPNVMPTSSPFVDLTNKVNNLIQAKLEPTKSIYSPNVQQTCNDENLLTLASLAVERSDGFKQKRLQPNCHLPRMISFTLLLTVPQMKKLMKKQKMRLLT